MRVDDHESSLSASTQEATRRESVGEFSGQNLCSCVLVGGECASRLRKQLVERSPTVDTKLFRCRAVSWATTRKSCHKLCCFTAWGLSKQWQAFWPPPQELAGTRRGWQSQEKDRRMLLVVLDCPRSRPGPAPPAGSSQYHKQQPARLFLLRSCCSCWHAPRAAAVAPKLHTALFVEAVRSLVRVHFAVLSRRGRQRGWGRGARTVRTSHATTLQVAYF